MAFADHLDALDDAVAEHVCDAGRLLRGETVLADPVSLIVERPSSVAGLHDGRGFVQEKPLLRAPVAQVASLQKGDEAQLNGRRWRVAGAPTRPDDGRWWVADVDDLGAVA